MIKQLTVGLLLAAAMFLVASPLDAQQSPPAGAGTPSSDTEGEDSADSANGAGAGSASAGGSADAEGSAGPASAEANVSASATINPNSGTLEGSANADAAIRFGGAVPPPSTESDDPLAEDSGSMSDTAAEGGATRSGDGIESFRNVQYTIPADGPSTALRPMPVMVFNSLTPERLLNSSRGNATLRPLPTGDAGSESTPGDPTGENGNGTGTDDPNATDVSSGNGMGADSAGVMPERQGNRAYQLLEQAMSAYRDGDSNTAMSTIEQAIAIPMTSDDGFDPAGMRMALYNAGLMAKLDAMSATDPGSEFAGHPMTSKAIDYFNQVIDLDNDPQYGMGGLYVRPYRQLGEIAIESNDPNTALSQTRTGLAINDSDTRLIEVFSEAALLAGDADQAAASDLELAIAGLEGLQPKVMTHYYNLGRLHFLLDAYNEARQVLQQAFQMAPADGDVLLLQGRVERADGQPQAALGFLDSARMDPAVRPDALLVMSEIYLEMEDNQAALEALSELVALEDPDGRVSEQIGDVSWRIYNASQSNADLQRAEQAYQNAIAACTSCAGNAERAARLYFRFGAVLAQQGDYTAARDQLTQSLDRNRTADAQRLLDDVNNQLQN